MNTKSRHYKRRALWLALFVAMLLSCFRADGRAVNTRGRALADDQGREVMLRGINAGGRSKLPPFLPFEPGDDFERALSVYADNIKDMGFNVVRLLVIYEAAEPERGVYNEEYLKKFDAMVEAFSERGIYIIVDGHQDLFSRRFHGDGFPDWAISKKYRDREQTHDRKIWNVGYFTWPVLTSFQRYWDDVDGIRERHVTFYGMLAERYQDEPMVIGFEPINEPMPGWKGLIDYRGFHMDLYDLYEKVGEAVQKTDPSYLVFADISAIENTGTIYAGRPRPDVKNLVLAPHYYDLGTFGLSISKGGDKPVMRAGIKRHLKLAENWEVPALFTEYGVSPALEQAPRYIDELYHVFDKRLLSGTFWEASMSDVLWNHEDTSIFTPEGELRPLAAGLDRPYPVAVSGRTQSFSYDPDRGACVLKWEEDRGLSAPTEIRVPRRVYGSTPTVTMDDGGKWEMDRERQRLVIENSGKSSMRTVVIERD